MSDIVALIDDIFFQSKLTETAKHVGVELKFCTTAAALSDEIAKSLPKLIVVDLNARSDPFEAIARAKSEAARVRLVAFLSHVQTDLAQRAREAGCAEVMPRSKFTRDLATILGRAKSQS